MTQEYIHMHYKRIKTKHQNEKLDLVFTHCTLSPASLYSFLNPLSAIFVQAAVMSCTKYVPLV